MAWLTAEKADALCTAIAVGFIKSQNTPGASTAFGYDADASDDEKAAHKALQSDLASMGVHVIVNQLADKSEEPMILAKRPETFDPAVLAGAVEPFRAFVAAAEKAINAGGTGDPPRGAYIGGMMDLEKIELAGPSDVALFAPPKHRELTSDQAEKMKAAFDNAKDATNKAWDFITSNAAKSFFSKVYITPTKQVIVEDYDGHSLFQSIHGMVRAIMQFGAHLGDAGICFELALGNKTNKVASCLPCSIFMRACKLPATNTHLGRGDNWNFPSSFWERASWEEAVRQHFREGLDRLSHNAKDSVKLLARDLGALNERVVPEAFLEALTFEGSFLGKMMRTLKLQLPSA